MPNNENTLTVAFLNVLRPMRHSWNVAAHPIRPFHENQKEPDAVITEPKRNAIAIEVKVDGERVPDISGEEQLRNDCLGKTLKKSDETIHTGIAIRFPHAYRDIEQGELHAAMAAAKDIRYILLSMDAPQRFPQIGETPGPQDWLTGSVSNIADAIRIGATPVAKIEQASQILERGIEAAGTLVDAAIAERPEIGKLIEKTLHQETCPQTTRMAMLIIGNAFIFQSSLAGKPELETVPSLSRLRGQNGLLDSDLVFDAWDTIQAVNYHSIYDVAVELVNAIALDDRLVGAVLWTLRSTARELEQMGLAREHELAGIVFQKLITDRRYIKAHYTRPESAALLSALVLPHPPVGAVGNRGYGKGRKTAASVHLPKIADFACGTGTLLNGVYQRLLGFHEQGGGKGEDIHQVMLENNLVGCDILPNAVHLTAAIIASTHPNIKIGDTRIYTMEYGTHRPDGQYAIGALNLLRNPAETLPIPMTTSRRVGGTGDTDTQAHQEFRHGEFHIVIQNPPFIKGNTDKNSEVPKTTFGDKDEEIERAMKKSLRSLKAKESVSDGNAGMGSHFVELADKMLRQHGTLGIVLPANAIAGTSWRKVRKLWASAYRDITVVTIANKEIANSTFSADTGIAECLVVATKGKGKTTGRGTFICLHRRPASVLEAREIANQIYLLGDIRRLEDGITGGNPVKIGRETVGYAMDAPLPDAEEGWPVCRVKDLGVVQAAHQLANGILRLPRQLKPLSIPICRLSDIAETSPGPLNIHGTGGRGGFDIEEGCPETADYPCLWHVDSDIQITMQTEPDAHALPRPNKEKRIADIMAVNSRTHYNQAMRFTASSLAVLFTEQKTIGVNTLPNVRFPDEKYEYAWALWGNSTLGLLCHWIQCGKQQQGRGILGRETLRALPTLDVTRLSPAQLAAAEQIFHELKREEFYPFNEMVWDAVRHQLDRRLLSEVLGFSEVTHREVHEGIALLRAKLCAEPSIDGGKKSRRAR
ncbi:hypothetical protein C6495_08605 [Candidatus Poribacteria bacterium]|nr:MAG: hypothetical protein C6495_08605 [Candidatus Poribacteria bacterium]